MEQMRENAKTIIKNIISENMPEAAVINALKNHDFGAKKIYLVAIGKAAWTMAKAATDYLQIEKGIVITKYEHSMGEIPKVEIFESGHPTPDENTVIATKKAMELIENLTENDYVLFLVSGGGSAIFEAPQDGISLEDLTNLTKDLLASGADIVEMNIVRKRLSKVKAGRFAELCKPASVFSVVLSDVLGDRLDTIASGPAAPDMSTTEDAMSVVSKYSLKLTDTQKKYLKEETPKKLDNVQTVITGSVRSLCQSAAKSAQELGYKPYILTTMLNCEASEAGRFLSSIAIDTVNGTNHFETPCAIIAGGETVVNLKGDGKGGRNQELALSAAVGISDLENILIFSLGSDGTDGPTDAAGGIVDTKTIEQLKKLGFCPDKILLNNDAYSGLKAVDSLIITGPTGTNVNDVSVILCNKK